METLLDRHLATFDTWLQTCFVSFLTASSPPYHYFTVVTLLDQLDLKNFTWLQVKVILQHHSPLTSFDNPAILFGGTKFNIEFIQRTSKFLMDRDRAGSLWVDSHKYAGLATYISEILGDK